MQASQEILSNQIENKFCKFPQSN